MSKSKQKSKKQSNVFTAMNQQNAVIINLLEQGIIFHKLGKFDQASKIYKEVLKQNPQNFDAIYFLATVATQKKQWANALELYKKALFINTQEPFAHYNLGIVYQELNQLDEALNSYKAALDIYPSLTEAYYNSGVALCKLKQYDKSLKNYKKAIEKNPSYAEAYAGIGDLYRELNCLEESLESYTKAIELKERNSVVHNNRGNILKELRRFDEALDSYDRAIEISSDHVMFYVNRGIVLNELGLKDESLVSIQKAIDIDPSCIEAYVNMGVILLELKRYVEAINYFNNALNINPEYDFLYGAITYTKLMVCDWSGINEYINKIIEGIKEDKKYIQNFALLAISDSALIHLRAAELWMKSKKSFNHLLEKNIDKKYYKENKIKVGYYSADFYNHATAYLMAGLFESHNKNKFEIIAFSFGSNANDEMHKRLKKSFNEFIDVGNKSDKEIALLSRKMGIDIAVDLKGFTKNARVGIFSYRAAPIQVSYIGYPGTMATDYIDYLIADETIIPNESQKFYSEKIVYMPSSYQPNDRKKVISEKIFSRSELGLPEKGFVYCCFNNNFKINPAIFQLWAAILNEVHESVLWLLEDNPESINNIKNEAYLRGINPNRIIAAKRMNLPEHLARHRCADLFLDTNPYNAHTTASDALWAGLPILTLMGNSFPSRVGASLLNAIELPELITKSNEEYVNKAIELAKNPQKLAVIKIKLMKNKLTTALFDTDLYTSNIEMAYEIMHERYHSNLSLDNIYIKK